MNEIEQSNPISLKLRGTRKSFFKKFLWLWIVLSIGLIVIGFYVISGTNNDKDDDSKSKKSFSLFGDKTTKYDKRIVKTYSPESGAAFKYNSPLLYNDHLYLGTSQRIGYDNALIADMPDNYFYKMDLDFNISWQYPLEKSMVTSGAVMDSKNNIYFIAELITDNRIKLGPNDDKEKLYLSKVELFSLTEDGKFRWKKQVSPELNYWNRSMIGLAISADDIVYLGNDRFYAFDGNGNQVGQYPDDTKKIKGFGGAPVIDSFGNVYFTAPEPVALSQDFNTEVIKAYKFSPKLADLTWSTNIGNEIMNEIDPKINPRKGLGVESTPALTKNDKGLISIVASTISKIDTDSGKLLWSTKPEGIIGYISASPVIDADDNIYIGSKSNQYSKFFAIKADGSLMWRHDVGADLYNSPILGDDNKIYVGSETVEKDGKYHVLDRLTGEQVWSVGTNKEEKIPDFSFGSGLLYNGYIYIGVHSADEGNDSGEFSPTLYKIKVDANNYLPNASWPRLHRGNTNSGRTQ
jgi:outer membrane protein assembly factor BamB